MDQALEKLQRNPPNWILWLGKDCLPDEWSENIIHASSDIKCGIKSNLLWINAYGSYAVGPAFLLA
jgi:hypothetical protein